MNGCLVVALILVVGLYFPDRGNIPSAARSLGGSIDANMPAAQRLFTGSSFNQTNSSAPEPREVTKSSDDNSIELISSDGKLTYVAIENLGISLDEAVEIQSELSRTIASLADLVQHGGKKR